MVATVLVDAGEGDGEADGAGGGGTGRSALLGTIVDAIVLRRRAQLMHPELTDDFQHSHPDLPSERFAREEALVHELRQQVQQLIAGEAVGTDLHH